MAKRVMVAKKVYHYADGETGRSFKPGCTALDFQFLDSMGEKVVDTITVKPSDFPDNVQEAAGWHGLAQKIGDSYAGRKDADQSAFEMASEMVEALKEGTWVAEGESAGPRTTLVLSALANVVAATKKIDLAKLETDKPEDFKTLMDGLHKSIATKEQKAAALKDARIKAEYERLKAEAAAERARMAAEAAAKGAGEDDFLATLG